jgi:site-specific DNA-methyltransferase (adenine-specific)
MQNNVILGDCLDVMASLPAASVDLILTDPPYFKVKDEDWDRQWDSADKFIDWIGACCEQWRRLLKPNGSIYVFASPQMSARVELEIGRHFRVLNRITWAKPYGQTTAERACKEDLRAFFRSSESIIFAEQLGADSQAKSESGYAAKIDDLRADVFSPLRDWLVAERTAAGVTIDDINKAIGVSCMASHFFSRTQWALPTEAHYLRMREAFPGFFVREYEELRREYEELRREYEELRREYEELRRPFFATPDRPYTDTWAFGVVHHYNGKHPCEKPQAMLRHIIETSSRRGDVVLDCFAGSGATLVAAEAMGRQAIGIEKDPHWAQYAQSRLDHRQLEIGEIQ